MMRDEVAPQAEDLVSRWLGEDDREQAGQLLDTLIARYAEPVVRRIVRFKLGGAVDDHSGRSSAADVDDVCNTALGNLISRLVRLKQESGRQDVRNFTSYAAVTAPDLPPPPAPPTWFRGSRFRRERQTVSVAVRPARFAAGISHSTVPAHPPHPSEPVLCGGSGRGCEVPAHPAPQPHPRRTGRRESAQPQ